MLHYTDNLSEDPLFLKVVSSETRYSSVKHQDLFCLHELFIHLESYRLAEINYHPTNIN